MENMEELYSEAKNIGEDLANEFETISDRILDITDKLGSEIIKANVEVQMNDQSDILTDKINYFTDLRSNFDNLFEPTLQYEDKKALIDNATDVAGSVLERLEKDFNVGLFRDVEFYDIKELLEDVETLYEFIFIRRFENIVTYFNARLRDMKKEILNAYKGKFLSGEYNNDVFISQKVKKFKNLDDVVILTFMYEIIDDIRDSNKSFEFFVNTVIDEDEFEEYNYRVKNMMNSGFRGLAIIDNVKSYDNYMSLLDDESVRNELRNSILMNYISGCELND